MSTLTRIIAIAACLAAASPAFAGYKCKGSFTSTGNTKLTKFGALSSAREVWKAQVRAQYGTEYADWNAARGKTSACEKSGMIFNFQCQVTARPCL
jgi:hypothetical protein